MRFFSYEDGILTSGLEQTKPLVSVIIVNYDGEKYLNKLFESLSRQTLDNFEVVVVDNASSDDSPNILEHIASSRILPRIHILKNKENVGFCIGNNQGLKLAKGDYIVFLNNDTYVNTVWLEELVKRVQSEDKPIAVVSCIVSEGSNSSNYGNFYDVYGATLARTAATDTSFFYGCGASLLTRKDVLERIGGLDPAFFMYQDDPDLCWQLRLLNGKIVCAQRSICYHFKSSENILETNLAMPVWKFDCAHAKNRIRVLLKNYSYHNLLKRLPLAVILVQTRALLLTFRNKTPGYLEAVIRGLLWNLNNLAGTLKERYKIQRMRKVKDRDIERYMLPYSIEIWGLKLFLFERSSLYEST